jgi:hypothetical protein
MAQGRGQYSATLSVGREASHRTTYATSPVSPYVNLGVNANGVSNYQTLVRPMIDEREASRQQMDGRLQPRQQARDLREVQDQRDSRGGDSKSSGSPVVRFMHYSHFYGGLR